jgi:hypothetical protein
VRSGSLESRVLVSARKLAEMGVSDDELTVPPQIDLAPRPAAGAGAAELIHSRRPLHVAAQLLRQGEREPFLRRRVLGDFAEAALAR